MTYTPDTPLEALAGIGPKKAQAFQKLGVATLRDLAGLYPRRYEDRTQFRTIAAAQPGEAVCIRATVAGEPRTQYVRSGLTLVKARIADDTGALDVTYFNQPYRKNSLHAGEEYIFYGKVEANGFRKTLTNPVCEQAARCGSVTNCFYPIYPLTTGVTQNDVRKAMLPRAARLRRPAAGRDPGGHCAHLRPRTAGLRPAKHPPADRCGGAHARAKAPGVRGAVRALDGHGAHPLTAARRGRHPDAKRRPRDVLCHASLLTHRGAAARRRRRRAGHDLRRADEPPCAGAMSAPARRSSPRRASGLRTKTTARAPSWRRPRSSPSSTSTRCARCLSRSASASDG